MFNQIVPQLWMLIPKDEREYIANAFHLTRTGTTEIIDQTVVTDGYTAEDLKGITLEKMCEFIGSQESFGRAWELTTMKAHSELHPPKVFIGNMEQLKNLRQVSNEEFTKLTGQKAESNQPTKQHAKNKKSGGRTAEPVGELGV